MTITRLRTAKVSVPIPKRAVTVGGPVSCECVLVWLEDDEEIAGQSCIWLMGRQNLDAYESAVRALEGRVVGRDARAVDEIRAALWQHLRHQFGTKGIGVTAASALEWAAWDLLGKRRGASVSSMLGRRRDRVPAYVGGSLWFDASIAQLRTEAEAWVADGFRALKMRAGAHGVDEDVKRISAVRDAVGDNVEMMIDCLQQMDYEDALALGRRVEDLNLAWIEDPLDCRDLEGHARLAEELETPIATGLRIHLRRRRRRTLRRAVAPVGLLVGRRDRQYLARVQQVGVGNVVGLDQGIDRHAEAFGDLSQVVAGLDRVLGHGRRRGGRRLRRGGGVCRLVVVAARGEGDESNQRDRHREASPARQVPPHRDFPCSANCSLPGG